MTDRLNIKPSIHPKAPYCRRCHERIGYNFTIQLCQDCRDEIKEEAEWIKFEEDQTEFYKQ